MKLITEEVQKVKFITEGKGAEKKMCIEGIFLQGDICNRNGRMYPMNTLSKEVQRYNETFVQKGRALGELGHPDGPTVNLDRVSHKIVSLTQEGSNFKGKAQLLDTPMGKIAKSLIGEGVTLGVSSRGVGSLRTTNEGHKIVETQGGAGVGSMTLPGGSVEQLVKTASHCVFADSALVRGTKVGFAN